MDGETGKMDGVGEWYLPGISVNRRESGGMDGEVNVFFQ